MANDTDWMPSTLGGKVAMMSNVVGKIGGYGTELDLTAGEITAIQTLCNEFVVVYNYHVAANAAASGLTEWRDNAFYGSPKGAALPDPPAFAAFSNNEDYKIGILNIFRDLREQWVAASGYTQAIGEDLMIVKPDGGELPEVDVTPTIQVSAAEIGYSFGILVSGRAASDLWIVETKQKGQDWKNAGSFTGKSADITITPLTPGDPEQVEVLVRLRKDNQDYGNLSQIATVTVNP